MGGKERPERRGPERGRHRQAATKWRSRASGLPAPRPRLAGSAAHPRLDGRGTTTPPRASAATAATPAGRPAGHARDRHSATRRPDQRCRTGLRSPDGAWRPARNRARRPAARRCARGAAVGRRTLSGARSRRQCASSAPLSGYRFLPHRIASLAGQASLRVSRTSGTRGYGRCARPGAWGLRQCPTRIQC